MATINNSAENPAADDDQEQPQCCGSGCNNCILDCKTIIIQSSNNLSKTNIFSQKYIKFQIEEIEQHTQNCLKLKFLFKNEENLNLNDCILSIEPGQYIMLRIPSKLSPNDAKYDKETMDNYISRPYTPINVDCFKFKFEILLKLERNGRMSEYFQKLFVEPNEIRPLIDCKGSYGSFSWQPNLHKNLLCFSQGVAIAPIYEIINRILSNELDETVIDLFGCFKNLDEILLRHELNDFRQYWNFRAHIFLSQELQFACKCSTKSVLHCKCAKLKYYNEKIYPFRLNYNNLLDLLTLHRIKDIIQKSLILICGKNDFIKSTKDMFDKLHVIDKQIFMFEE